MDFDSSNVDSIVDRIITIPKFKFNKLEDNYNNIFVNSKSKYKEEMKMKVKVKCICNYYDMECSERKVFSKDVPYENPEQHPNRCEWITTRERAEHLESKGLVKILETINEVVKEDKKKPTKKIEKK